MALDKNVLLTETTSNSDLYIDDFSTLVPLSLSDALKNISNPVINPDPPPTPPNDPDTEAPTSTVDALPNSIPATFDVSWYGFDNGDSGIATYDIFVSTDGGEYVLWLDDTTALSGVYQGQSQRSYEFYSVATDNAGNSEATNQAQASTTTNSTSQQPAIYRLFNSSTGVHLYTANLVERDSVIQNLDNYTYEGVAYFAARSDNGVRVYRLYSPSVDGHFYTVDETERDEILASTDFVDEGAAFTAFDTQVEGTLPVYRFFDSGTGAYFYTSDENERASVEQNLPNYASQGIAFYSYPLNADFTPLPPDPEPDPEPVGSGGFNGATLTYQAYSPDLETAFGGPIDFTPGEGVELNFSDGDGEATSIGATVDLSNNKIVYEVSTDGGDSSFLAGEFNGFVIFDLTDTLPTVSTVTIDPAGTTLAVDESDIIFIDDAIAVNLENLSYTDGDTVAVNVEFESQSNTDTDLNTDAEFEDISGSDSIEGNLDASDIPFSDEVSRNFSDDYLLTGVSPDQQVSISMESADFDTYLEVFAIDANNNASLVISNDDLGETLNSGLDFIVEAGFDYAIAAGGFDDEDLGAYTLTTNII